MVFLRYRLKSCHWAMFGISYAMTRFCIFTPAIFDFLDHFRNKVTKNPLYQPSRFCQNDTYNFVLLRLQLAPVSKEGIQILNGSFDSGMNHLLIRTIAILFAER